MLSVSSHPERLATNPASGSHHTNKCRMPNANIIPSVSRPQPESCRASLMILAHSPALTGSKKITMQIYARSMCVHRVHRHPHRPAEIKLTAWSSTDQLRFVVAEDSAAVVRGPMSRKGVVVSHPSPAPSVTPNRPCGLRVCWP